MLVSPLPQVKTKVKHEALLRTEKRGERMVAKVKTIGKAVKVKVKVKRVKAKAKASKMLGIIIMDGKNLNSSGLETVPGRKVLKAMWTSMANVGLEYLLSWQCHLFRTCNKSNLPLEFWRSH